MIFFIGSDLDVAQNPRLIYNGIQVSSPLSPTSYPITTFILLSYNVNTTALSCIAPMVMGNPVTIAYTLILDDVPPPDLTRPELLLSLRPNPGNFMLVTKEVSTTAVNAIIQIGVSLLEN